VRPTKRRKTTDADDFIVPSDEEEEDPVLDVDASSLSSVPKKSSKSKPDKNLSTLVLSSDEGEDEEGLIPTKTSSKKNTKPRLSNASSNVSMKDFGASGGGATGAGMLTAAERRIQAVKDQKKAEEKPYDFLMDVMDVSALPHTPPLPSIGGCGCSLNFHLCITERQKTSWRGRI
jgi:hypothetical protein